MSEVVVAAVMLVILSPVFLLIAIVILITMGRPIIFRQVRMGHRGQFMILKFRTMVRDAEKIGDGFMAKQLDLITPFGAFLRVSSLDEIPQLVNVLRGDMSFVGPRPALPEHVAKYTPRQRHRLRVPQGITGLAQVRYRNEAPWSKRIESDIEYVEILGPIVDMKILCMTVWAVLAASGVRDDQTADEVDDLGHDVSSRQ